MKDSHEFPGTVTAIARSLRLGQGQRRLGADGGAGLGTAGGARLGAAGGAGLGAAGGAGLGATGETEPGALPVLQEPSNSSSNSLVQAMLQQQQQQRIFQEKTFSMISSLLQDKETSRDKEESQTKRKNKEESTTSPQEPIMILEESYRIKDDGHKTLDTKLRQRLRPINADPKIWWVKGAFNRVESPVLGASLHTEHLMPGMVAEKTILMAHDRGAHIELKNFLTKNSNVFSESKKKLKVTDDLAGEMHLGIRTDWQSAATVWEAVDAGLNYAAVEFMVRSYNYSPLAMIRCLHECR